MEQPGLMRAPPDAPHQAATTAPQQTHDLAAEPGQPPGAADAGGTGGRSASGGPSGNPAESGAAACSGRSVSSGGATSSSNSWSRGSSEALPDPQQSSLQQASQPQLSAGPPVLQQPPQRNHHLLRHTVADKAEARSKLLQHLGLQRISRAARTVARKGQRELQDLFRLTFGQPTHSNNNDWLKKKLLEVLEVSVDEYLERYGRKSRKRRRRQRAGAGSSAQAGEDSEEDEEEDEEGEEQGGGRAGSGPGPGVEGSQGAARQDLAPAADGDGSRPFKTGAAQAREGSQRHPHAHRLTARQPSPAFGEEGDEVQLALAALASMPHSGRKKRSLQQLHLARDWGKKMSEGEGGDEWHQQRQRQQRQRRPRQQLETEGEEEWGSGSGGAEPQHGRQRQRRQRHKQQPVQWQQPDVDAAAARGSQQQQQQQQQWQQRQWPQTQEGRAGSEAKPSLFGGPREDAGQRGPAGWGHTSLPPSSPQVLQQQQSAPPVLKPVAREQLPPSWQQLGLQLPAAAATPAAAAAAAAGGGDGLLQSRELLARLIMMNRATAGQEGSAPTAAERLRSGMLAGEEAPSSRSSDTALQERDKPLPMLPHPSLPRMAPFSMAAPGPSLRAGPSLAGTTQQPAPAALSGLLGALAGGSAGPGASTSAASALLSAAGARGEGRGGGGGGGDLRAWMAQASQQLSSQPPGSTAPLESLLHSSQPYGGSRVPAEAADLSAWTRAGVAVRGADEAGAGSLPLAQRWQQWQQAQQAQQQQQRGVGGAANAYLLEAALALVQQRAQQHQQQQQQPQPQPQQPPPPPQLQQQQQQQQPQQPLQQQQQPQQPLQQQGRQSDSGALEQLLAALLQRQGGSAPARPNHPWP